MDGFKSSLNEIQSKILAVRNDYAEFIRKNPSRATDIESSVKLLSYMLQGRLRNSTIIPELLYCSSNLLTFWHDLLLRAEAKKNTKAKQTNTSTSNGNVSSSSSSQSQRGDFVDTSMKSKVKQIFNIKSALTILEYFEVFLEVGAKAMWGDIGRWLVILIVQSIKAGLRAALLFHFKIGMIESPAIQPYKRIAPNGKGSPVKQANLVFVLKHSGRVIRKIHAAPPVAVRNWLLPEASSISTLSSTSYIPQDLPPLRMLAEVIHILRPLVHLIGLGLWGTKSWKPWIASFALDITSLQLHGQHTRRLRPDEKSELARRNYALLYYLIRSPFYDKFTKRRLLTSLLLIGDKVPIFGHICTTLAHSIPEWQETYSYIWNDS